MQNDGNPKISRRTFLSRILGGAGALVAMSAGGWWIWKKMNPEPPEIPVRIVGANAKQGHRLRKSAEFVPAEVIEKDVVIVGGGIAGLSAAWTLQKVGITDFVVLDLEERVGGNSSSGQNDISAYPWGAHYVPIPDPQNTDLMQLFEALGVVKGYNQGKPWYEEAYLCQAPHERLFIHGSWQDGLVPKLGVPEGERSQFNAFHQRMEHWKAYIGSDGKPAFAIPVAHSSQDAECLAFDQVTMKHWMLDQGWDSEHLHWYVNYCCRDDFGTTHAECSAWAGIHYFAARAGSAANASESDVLTWPEGNGWLAQEMAKKFHANILAGHLVVKVRNVENGVEVDAVRSSDGQQIRFRAKSVVVASPRFVTERIVENLPVVEKPSYAPWVVANLSLTKRPEGRGTALAWDNVPYGSESLGYIVADHQSLRSTTPDKTVLTWYLPLTAASPEEERKQALAATDEEWRDRILSDMELMHPDLRDHLRSIDVWIWGHGMVRPLPGVISGNARQEMALPQGRIAFAHSDLSGISIFEEAFYWGTKAARQVLDWMPAAAG